MPWMLAVNIPRDLGQGLVGVWRLYHFPVVPTQGSILEKGEYKKKINIIIISLQHSNLLGKRKFFLPHNVKRREDKEPG